jgi:hypothetical protein
MTVDLSAGTEGIVQLSGGARWWCPSVQPDRDYRDYYSVRIESGWYRLYTRDGKPHPDGGRQHVVEFIPCGSKDPRARGLPSETTP